MAATTLHRAMSLAAGLLIGVTCWVATDPLLAGALGICVVVGSLLLFRIRRQYVDRFADESWRERLWIAGGVGALTLVAINGLLLVPVPDEYRFALQSLVLLAGVVGHAVGSLTETEPETTQQGDGTQTVAPTGD